MFARTLNTFRYLRSFNAGFVILLAVTALTLLGLVVLASASQTFSAAEYTIFKKQVVWLALALLGCGAVMSVDLEWARRLAGPAALVTLGLLVAVLVVGKEVNGARRWLEFGPMRMQVSEFAKVTLIFTLAHYLGREQRNLKAFVRGFVYPCLIIGVPVGLIFVQPDFGTAALCAAVGLTLLFLAGGRLVYLVPAVAAGLALFSVAVYLDPVRWKRITSFLDVQGNLQDGAWQLWQGILAFAAGGLTGVGLGNGRQQLSFLPEAHTDFIFPIIGEELGFVFTSGVVLLFMVIFVAGFWSLRRAPNLYQFMLAAGALLFLTVQALINMGVVTGCLPTKGMSLPFISYGGSNLVVMFLLVGILLNCFREWSLPALRRRRDL